MDRPAAATVFLSIFPGTAGKVLYWVIVIGAIAGLFTSWNGFYMASANLLMGMSRGRLMPKIFKRQNDKGVPVPGLIVCLILSLAGPFLGPNLIDSITCFSATAFVLSWSFTSWSLVKLKKSHPEMERPYKIPGGMAMGLFAAVVSSLVLICMFIPVSPFFVGSLSVKMFVCWMVIGLVLYLGSFGQRKGLSRKQLEEGVFGHLKKTE